jgi:hypothetical protein
MRNWFERLKYVMERSFTKILGHGSGLPRFPPTVPSSAPGTAHAVASGHHCTATTGGPPLKGNGRLTQPRGQEGAGKLAQSCYMLPKHNEYHQSGHLTSANCYSRSEKGGGFARSEEAL